MKEIMELLDVMNRLSIDKYELYEYLRTEAEYIGDPLPDSITQLISQVDPNKASKE